MRKSEIDRLEVFTTKKQQEKKARKVNMVTTIVYLPDLVLVHFFFDAVLVPMELQIETKKRGWRQQTKTMN